MFSRSLLTSVHRYTTVFSVNSHTQPKDSKLRKNRINLLRWLRFKKATSSKAKGIPCFFFCNVAKHCQVLLEFFRLVAFLLEGITWILPLLSVEEAKKSSSQKQTKSKEGSNTLTTITVSGSLVYRDEVDNLLVMVSICGPDYNHESTVIPDD